MSDSTPVKRSDWNERISFAEQMVPPLGQLRRNSGVVTPIFGRRLENITETGTIKLHYYARRITSQELPLSQILSILQELVKADLDIAPIDLGTLATSFEEEGGDLRTLLERELADVTGARAQIPKTSIVLYDSGHIGRLLAHILLTREAPFSGPRLRVIVVRRDGGDNIVKRASLLRRDSIHGVFSDIISVDRENNIIWTSGASIQVIYSSDPATIDYTAYDISDVIAIDNAGR